MSLYVCDRSELKEKEPYVKELEGLVVGVILLDGEIHVYENKCPHMEGPVCLGDVKGRVKTRLNEKKEAVGEYESDDEVHLICPWHGLEFNVRTGACIPESAYHLRRFDAYVQDEKIYLNL